MKGTPAVQQHTMVHVSLHMQPALVIPVETRAIVGQKCDLIGRKVTS